MILGECLVDGMLYPEALGQGTVQPLSLKDHKPFLCQIGQCHMVKGFATKMHGRQVVTRFEKAECVFGSIIQAMTHATYKHCL